MHYTRILDMRLLSQQKSFFLFGPRSTGKALEHLIALELRAYLSYRRLRYALTFWRTYFGVEVDFVIGDHAAVEGKSARTISDKHLRGLRAFLGVAPGGARILVSLDENNRQTSDGIRILHWSRFLEELWANVFF